MAAIIQTPLLHGSDAIELSGGTWTKRVLPIGQVEYQGRMLTFDRDYLNDLADAYNRGAYDQVPFQLADATNRHTNDPERMRGWVTGMTVKNDGLWVTVDTTEAGNALLESNPRLGISARIVEEYARSDGNFYPAAIQHVLGTLDPRIPELGDWQPVEMSNGYGGDIDMIIDMSASDWEGEPAYDPYDFAGGTEHPVARSMRALSKELAAQYPDLGTDLHVNDAADAMDRGNHDAAIRHLRAAIGNMTPTSLRRHGMLSDAQHNGAKASMDDIHRHLLMVQEDRDAQATDRQATGGRADQNTSGPAFANGTEPDGNGLSPRGQGVYKKLIAKGVPPKVAMAMARRSQNAKPGVQFANDGLSDPAGAMIELAYAQAAQREAENAAMPVRRRTGTGITEDRLKAVLDRVERGTYMPTQAQRSLGFAGDGGGDGTMPGPFPAGGCSCGATGHDGRTVSTTHWAGCEKALSGDEQAAAYKLSGRYDVIAQTPFEDADGRTWGDQDGYAMTLADHLEALTGQRVTREPFNGLERPELSVPQRDYNDKIRAMAADLGLPQRDYSGEIRALGLGDHRAAREEARSRAFDRLVQRPPQRYRTIGEAMEHGESMRERRERYQEPYESIGRPSTSFDDGLNLPGELTGLSIY